MQYILLFLWHSTFRRVPSYLFRNVVFTLLLKNTIGSRSSLHRSIELYSIGGISIGEGSTINKYVDLDGRGNLIIGNNVSISAYAKIITASHDPNSSDFKYITKPVVIEDYVWVGTNALILPGVRLKKGCVIAAGSVVTKDIEEYCIVGGNPAKLIAMRSSHQEYTPFWRPYLQ